MSDTTSTHNGHDWKPVMGSLDGSYQYCITCYEQGIDIRRQNPLPIRSRPTVDLGRSIDAAAEALRNEVWQDDHTRLARIAVEAAAPYLRDEDIRNWENAHDYWKQRAERAEAEVERLKKAARRS